MKFLLLISLTWFWACGFDSADSKISASPVFAQTVSPGGSNNPAGSKNDDDSILYFDEIYTADEKLTYGAYQIEKRSKTIWLKDAEMNAEVTYIVLKRGGKPVAAFEGVRYPLGNDARFALFPVLGQKSNQLIIEQKAHRTWRHWVVNLSPSFKVIYDSGDYPVGHSLRAIDIDKDGTCELIQSLHTFWFWERLTNVDSPLTEIVFAYHPALKRYVPANPQFQKFALRNIEDNIRKTKEIKTDSNAPGQDGGKLGAVLEVFLSYTYAGKEPEAWSFYESEYNLPDKEEMKVKIQKRLREDVVYQAIKK